MAQLAELFQQFYITAFQQVDAHISGSYLSLSSKKPRPSPSASKNPTQMLSLGEIAQKKRDRKLLEIKKLAFEEAVERRVTGVIYDRIWRHKSTDDEARDESLRSKMAALNVVGVKLAHLGVELEGAQGDIEEELQPAVDALVGMNEPKHPLGKLLSLKEAHKAIVGTSHNSYIVLKLPRGFHIKLFLVNISSGRLVIYLQFIFLRRFYSPNTDIYSHNIPPNPRLQHHLEPLFYPAFPCEKGDRWRSCLLPHQPGSCYFIP